MNLIDRIYNINMYPPEEKNTLRSYLPYRSKAYRNKSDLFDYSIVAGKVLEEFLGKRLKARYTVGRFREDCLTQMQERLTDETILPHIDQMYLGDDFLRTVSPEFILLGGSKGRSPSSKHLSTIFCSFLAKAASTGRLESNVNFLENFFRDNLWKNLENASIVSHEEPYLPFLATHFVQDLTFLAKHTDYMIQRIENFLELYNFLYCSQLALNIKSFSHGEPKSKPLYFILDTEKASQERMQVRISGYESLYNSLGSVFPILSLLEHFNGLENEEKRHPLWHFTDLIKDAEDTQRDKVYQALTQFSELFVTKKKIPERYHQEMLEKVRHSDALEAVNGLVECAIGQFDTKKCTNDKRKVFEDYKNAFVRHVGRHFVQTRGRAGRVLVMNQDFLMLLTNLALANENPLRFQDLLDRFKQRGVYFDKQSQQILISFYERVGNVERMSDSGDAVYVRSTI